MKRVIWVGIVAFWIFPGLLSGQEAQATPEVVSPAEEPGLSWERPPAVHPERTTVLGRVRAQAPRRDGAPPEEGVLKDTRALSLEEGEARLLVNGAERTVHPGDSLGPDVVTSVGEDRIVLVRPASVDPLAGESIVIVTFDAAGKPRVRVISEKDKTAVRPPEIP